MLGNYSKAPHFSQNQTLMDRCFKVQEHISTTSVVRQAMQSQNFFGAKTMLLCERHVSHHKSQQDNPQLHALNRSPAVASLLRVSLRAHIWDLLTEEHHLVSNIKLAHRKKIS